MKKVDKLHKISLPFYIIFSLTIVDTIYYEYKMLNIYKQDGTLECKHPQDGKNIFINKKNYSNDDTLYFTKKVKDINNTEDNDLSIPLQLCKIIN